MAAKTSCKAQNPSVSKAPAPSKSIVSTPLAETPAGYWRAPVNGAVWPPRSGHRGHVTGVLADIDTVRGPYWTSGAPLPALVLKVDEETEAWDPVTASVVRVPAGGAVRVPDAGFAKFSRLLAQPGKIPHVAIQVARWDAVGPLFVADVSTHLHDAAAYGLAGSAGSAAVPAPVPGSSAGAGAGSG